MTVIDELQQAGVAIERLPLPSESYIRTLNDLGFHFRLNLMDMSIEVNTAPLSEITAAAIRTAMRDRGLKNMAAIEDAYMVEARTHAYHPIKDYLNGLTYDGRPHIETLAKKMHSDNEPIRYKDGTTMPLHAVYLYRWLIGAVAKVLDGEQNPMLVWDGPQGIGKSLLARWLCPIPTAFIEAPIDVRDKDCDVRLMNTLVWEVSELDATTRKADVSGLKAFITKGKVRVRKAYARHDVIGTAICSFIGTVNNTTGFLADETGSRRFYISRLTRIDWDYRSLDLDQIWAQAVHLYLAGESPRLCEEEQQAQRLVNQKYEVETPLEDWLQAHFTVTNDPSDRLTMGDIIDHLRSKDIRLSGPERAQAGEVARVLSHLGVTRATRWHNGKPAKVWEGIVINHA